MVQHLFGNLPLLFIDGFIEFHKQIIDLNKKACLVTNAPNYALNIIKKRLDLELLFNDHIYNSCIVDNLFKPDPAILQYAFARLNVTPENCIVFEDSIDGILAAKAAGIKYIIQINNKDVPNYINGVTHVISDYKNLNFNDLLLKLKEH